MIRLEQSSGFEIIENLLHGRGIVIFSVFDRETIHCFLHFTIIERINNLFIENTIMKASRKDFFDLVKSCQNLEIFDDLVACFFLFPTNCKQSKLFSVTLIC